MTRILFCLTFTQVIMGLCCSNVIAQYYYKDIWNPLQLTKEMAILKAEKIRTISVKSFDENGEPGEGFFCEEKINKSYSLSETVTRSNITSQSLLSSYFNPKGFVIKTSDSTESSLNITEYLYNDSGQIVNVKTFAMANGDAGGIDEDRVYIYGTSGRMEKMVRKKNSTEFSTVNFKIDEKGNVIEEEEVAKNGEGKKYFYYYDSKNNLTDVVHYFDRAKRLLPDYMYEYNTVGQIKQMTTTEEGGGYFIWKYTYNDLRLRETERCFSKERKLLGSVAYSYK